MNKNIDILQLMQDYSQGKIDLQQVDWETQLDSLLRMCDLIKTPSQSYGWLYGLFTVIEDLNLRSAFIMKLFDASFNKQSKRLDKVSEDLMCIMDIVDNLRHFFKENPEYTCVPYYVWRGLGGYTYTDPQYLAMDELTMFYDKLITPEKLVALAEQLYKSHKSGIREPMLHELVHSVRYLGGVSFDSIYDFSKYLFMAEGHRTMLLSGVEDFNEIPSIDTFSRKLRNGCFDLYIEKRIEDDIKQEMDEDNSLLEDPSELDYYQQLYLEESSIANREFGMEQFKGSQAYHDMWYPGRPEVLKMMEYFLQYLKLKIEKMKTTPSIKVEGDYVAGSKNVTNMHGNVDQFIANVEHLNSNKE